MLDNSNISFTNIESVPSSDSNVIELEPMIRGANSPLPQNEPHSHVQQRLSPLIPHDILLIQDEMGDDILITDIDGRRIFKCQQTKISGTQRNRSSVGGTATDFVNDYGQILFTSERREMNARVTCGEFLLGEVNGDVCGCSRSFDATSFIDSKRYQMNPVGCITGVGCSCINSCCMEEYVIYSPNGTAVGKIKAGQAVKVTFAPGMDLKTKALLLAGSLLIYELYFANCCGRVGIMGSRYICSCLFIGIATFIGIICLIYYALQELNDKEIN